MYVSKEQELNTIMFKKHKLNKMRKTDKSMYCYEYNLIISM